MKKSIKRTLAIALTLVMALGIGIPAFAAPATAAAPVAQAETRKFEPILLLPILGPFIYYFMDRDNVPFWTVLVMQLVSPLIGSLLNYYGIL